MKLTKEQNDVYTAVEKGLLNGALIPRMLMAVNMAIFDTAGLPEDVAAYLMERWAADYKKHVTEMRDGK